MESVGVMLSTSALSMPERPQPSGPPSVSPRLVFLDLVGACKITFRMFLSAVQGVQLCLSVVAGAVVAALDWYWFI